MRLGNTVLQFRRSALFYGCLRLLFVFCVVYWLLRVIDLVSTVKYVTNFRSTKAKDDITEIQQRIIRMENDIRRNNEMLAEIKHNVKGWLTGKPGQINPKRYRIGILPSDFATFNHTPFLPLHSDCQLCMSHPAEADENVLDIYSKLDFRNTDGGVWKQGWDIVYDENQWNLDQKLKIFVVPHSHNDPGWIKTFEKYFKDQTQHILNNMVIKMKDDKRRKFIWAETSFFSYWWEHVDNNAKEIVKRYLSDGQLEIVTGGWVMNDEATTHYYAMIEQMVEGHQWLEQNLDYRPKNGWAIDPFGLSPTMAYLLRRMGLDNMVIQRVHYSVKKYLAQKKRLEFLWRQPWDRNHTMDILCHIMPFYSYDIPHSCGPDPKVCCQFDFKRLPGNKLNCPWRVSPTIITERNIANKAWLLLDQYRKKAQLFKTNVIMIQLGDDFRYDKAAEWDQQFNNYQKLFDYINNKEEWHTEIQFGTLSDYFSSLREETGVDSRNMPSKFSSLLGDFFAYADRDDHYWTGFYTSRPFYKNMDRVLEAHLRGAEILFSLMWAGIGKSHASKLSFIEGLMDDLVYSRRQLSLFQHHDAITGTSKDHVVIDYATRLFYALHKLQNVIGQSAAYLLLPEVEKSGASNLAYFELDEYREQHSSLPMKQVIQFTKDVTKRRVVFYNSLSHLRREIITLHISSAAVEIKDYRGRLILYQINPVFTKIAMAKDVFEIMFVAEMPPLGLTTYTIEDISSSSFVPAKAKLTYLNVEKRPLNFMFHLRLMDAPDEFQVKIGGITAIFSGTDGLLRRIYFHEEELTVDLRIQFLKYGTRRKGKDKSGAYLFLPDTEAEEIEISKPQIRILEGPLMSEVAVFLPGIEHHIRLRNSPGLDAAGFDIYNVIDITKDINKELVMRFVTNITNENQDFFTDLNGLQMIKRHTFNKLPVQANVYPVTTMAFMENNESRFSVLTAHSLGVASLHPGCLEVFLDRRLNQDDNRGLQQGVTDNKQTPANFRIILEKFAGMRMDAPSQGYPSLLALHASLSLLHPVFNLITLDPQLHSTMQNYQHTLQMYYSPMGEEPPCDIHILNLRTLTSYPYSGTSYIPANNLSLFLHRLGFDCNYKFWGVNCSSRNGTVSIDNLFPRLFGSTVEEASLSLMYTRNKFFRDAHIQLPSMEIVTLKLNIR